MKASFKKGENMKTILKFSVIAAMGLSIAACGGGGGSGSESGGSVGGSNASGLTLKATALKSKTVVAAAPKLTDRMWALVSGREAIAQAACDDSKKFLLSDGTSFVCLEKAYVVFNEIELEKETEPSTNQDEIELGPFVVDLLGVADDNIPSNISLAVPAGSFNKIKFKVKALDDNDNDKHLGGSTDDNPKNVTASAADDAKLTGKSLVITGTKPDGITPFIFSSNIEGEIEIPFSKSVVDQSTLIAFFDLSAAFLATEPNDIGDDGSMGGKKCDDPSATKLHELACRIVKNIGVYDDSNHNEIGDDNGGERLGDDHTGGGGFDDPTPHT